MWFEESVELQLEYYAQSDTPIDPYLTQTINTYMKMAPSLNLDTKVGKMIPNQVRCLAEDTLFGDDDWVYPWGQKWKSRWEDFGKLADDFGQIEVFSNALTELIPSVIGCLTSQDMIEKWQVVKELAELGGPDTQAALKQGVEDWLRSQVPKPEEITEETILRWRTNPAFRDTSAYKRYFSIAGEFGIDSSFICQTLRRHIRKIEKILAQSARAGYEYAYTENRERTNYDYYIPILRENCPGGN